MAAYYVPMLYIVRLFLYSDTSKCGHLWDLKKVSRLERCPNFRGEIIHVCIALGSNEVSSIYT